MCQMLIYTKQSQNEDAFLLIGPLLSVKLEKALQRYIGVSLLSISLNILMICLIHMVILSTHHIVVTTYVLVEK